ncbi:protein NRT1/ PTR FAMILY 5.4-like [Neltuma alba]|uniref:protein NRT1/ PTR FAMILY 5.4-like n=1 Tax=Neltuma alba TaxID=207710 RepID=UPI0010A48B43|nr:protein NRT1/ PTR FAMILY 5.4-like [Prosopis alba]
MDTTNAASKKANYSSSDDDNKPSTGGWNAVFFLTFVEMAERFAFYGLTGNLITFLTNDLEETTSAAAKIVNNWVGVSFVFPLLGAFIADSYLGRSKAIIFSSTIYFLGMILLTLSVSVIPLHSGKAVIFLALYIVAIGAAGQKPIVQTFAVNQFEESSLMAKSSFFNWFYFASIIAHVSALSIVIYVQDNVGWAIGFSILAAAVAVAFAVFLCGMNKYRRQVPFGSPFTSLAQVVVAAARKWRVDETLHGRGVCYGDVVASEYMTFSGTKKFRFLEKAMIIDDIDASRKTRDPWRLCSLNQVEETKQVLRLTPIWLTCLYNSVALAQLSTFFTKQASTMVRSIIIGPHHRHFIIPPASLQCITGFTIILMIPIYDRLFVPLVGKFTGKLTGITMLQRLGVGLFFSVLTMLVAALVEAKRVELASYHNLLDNSEAILPIRVWWLIPQYILCGVSEAFGIVGLQHFLYDQLPEAKKSLGAVFCICNAGIGNFISSGIIHVLEVLSKGKWLGNNFLNRSHLDLFYLLLAVLGFLDLGLFAFVAKRYVYRNAPQNYPNTKP